ncbi:transposase [Cryobacterium sinapicolor]|uniref:Transposase n=1 Tax=Cryobacterium sinapicolor TaxID=1259236 RepID=A0ABY2IVZ2_9MICO|nr:integrase core domain-containing protein [Cryobacterium sinapicolor]TFC93930.1 transposase [Cryobacterium sinapicolor]
MTATLTELSQEHGFSVERLARILWMIVCEPGDAMAGSLIADQGAVAALDLVLGGTCEDVYVVVLRERVLPRLESAEFRQVLATIIEDGHTVLIPSDDGWSDNSLAFNQLRAGTIGSVEIFLASKGTMPISGLPGKPTTQGKNERSHQTLIRYLDSDQPVTLEQLRVRIQRFREHYNNRRQHQALNQATPRAAWDSLEHTPATEPIPLSVLEAKASEYRQARKRRHSELHRASLTISKTGQVMPDDTARPQTADQSLVEVTRANRQVYFQGYHVSLPTTFADRRVYRTITETAFLLTDPVTAEIVFSFPLPMVALNVRGRYVASYSIQGVGVTHPTKPRERENAEYRTQFAKLQSDLPAVLDESGR